MNSKTAVCALGCFGFLALCLYFMSNNSTDGCIVSIAVAILCFALGVVFERKG